MNEDIVIDFARRFRDLMQDSRNHPPGMNCQHPFADLLILADQILAEDDARRKQVFDEFQKMASGE